MFWPRSSGKRDGTPWPTRRRDAGDKTAYGSNDCASRRGGVQSSRPTVCHDSANTTTGRNGSGVRQADRAGAGGASRSATHACAPWPDGRYTEGCRTRYDAACQDDIRPGQSVRRPSRCMSTQLSAPSPAARTRQLPLQAILHRRRPSSRSASRHSADAMKTAAPQARSPSHTFMPIRHQVQAADDEGRRTPDLAHVRNAGSCRPAPTRSASPIISAALAKADQCKVFFLQHVLYGGNQQKILMARQSG